MLETNKENNILYDCIKNSEILRIELTNEVKDLYTENYEALMEETEVDTNE